MFAECRCLGDDLFKDFFLLWLEWEVWDLALPLSKILKLRTSSISRDLDAPVADRTSISLCFLDFTTCDLQTLSMIPTSS